MTDYYADILAALKAYGGTTTLRAIEEQRRAVQQTVLAAANAGAFDTYSRSIVAASRHIDSLGLASAAVLREVEALKAPLMDAATAHLALVDQRDRAIETITKAATASFEVASPAGLAAFSRQVDAWRSASAAMIRQFEGLASHLAEAVESFPYASLHESLAAAATVAIDWRASPLSASALKLVASDLGALEEAYAATCLDEWSLRLPLVADLRLPEIDVASHSRVLRSLQSDDDLEPIADSVVADVREAIIRKVDRVSRRWGDKLRSAFGNVGSADPQAVSNACLAVRQVLLGLLHELAPEHTVKPWALSQNDPKLLLTNGRTTYRAQILYLSRFDRAEPSAYSRFLVQNADSLVTLIAVMQGEVHDESSQRPRPIVTSDRLEHLLIRAAAAIAELVACANMQAVIDEHVSG